MSKKKSRTVWSSDFGDMRKKAKNPAREKSLMHQQQIVYLHRETKGRGGKVVTLVKNLNISSTDIKTLAKKLKTACGSGGSVKGNVIEIQGEQREKITAVLKKMGYLVIIAGG
jgi:translation initiation factor 1